MRLSELSGKLAECLNRENIEAVEVSIDLKYAEGEGPANITDGHREPPFSECGWSSVSEGSEGVKCIGKKFQIISD
ncbi:MAG: hypothetical protein OXI88_23215 [Gammaproteobacteria bacterium]|nr:hypothetical protein [Gammaproteobacteria bacterium]